MVDVQSHNSNISTSSNVRMDITNPFYLHPSRNSGLTLLPNVLMELVIDHGDELYLRHCH